MARRRPQLLRGLIVTVVCLLCAELAALGAVKLAPDAVGRLLGAPDRSWRSGTPVQPAQPVLAAAGSAAVAPTASGVAAALGPLLRDPALGAQTNVSVVDALTGQRLFDQNSGASIIPASTLKLLTAEAVLKARGPAYRLPTRAVAGANPGEVVLVGGGDPTLGAGEQRTYADSARLDQLAAQVKQALGGTAPARVVVDSSLFGPAATGPGWDSDIVSSGNASPITALMINGGRTTPAGPHGTSPRTPTPDLDAGKAFAAALGVAPSAVVPGTAPAGAAQLGLVESPPVDRLVEMMLTESDNVVAECLARQVALARNQPGTFAGAAAAMRTVLGELGLPVDGLTLSDASGLSRLNRVTPALLTDALLLAVKPEHPDLRVIFSGLPVGGWSGTLRDRYRKPTNGNAAAGVVRAKTGSLSSVNAIAGIAVDADGRPLVFAFIASAAPPPDGVPSSGQQALDRVAAGLASCGCH
ncbi:D-alanyl-D-alanine carboxypeptidase/D-alanyl-D-alanine-endopeptidase [Planosporangium flavigriseum]|nr:D-alanyl-D-alanine carboxypeptidase/D-alanyl-D-alanine-endopeptidase [Planosporangium flavigriseum]NJC63754.1 D-alanyl-D-alanine carboxypeptidase/D-alanyl-D-alanine-endopeptidase [Planosporangium flavigriseum]